MLNDNEIITNTRIVPAEGHVEMRCALPDGDEFVSKARDAESAQKNIMKYCEAVRNYMEVKRQNKEAEQQAAKAARKSGTTPIANIPAPTPPPPLPGIADDDPFADIADRIKLCEAEIEHLGSVMDDLQEQLRLATRKLAKLKKVQKILEEDNE